MAYATTDRLGAVKANPQPQSEGFLLGDGEVIYAHTLFGVLAADGTAVNLNGVGAGAVKTILYTRNRLAADALNPSVHSGDPYEVTVEGEYNIVVRLTNDSVDGFTAGDEGAEAFLKDDSTVIATDALDGTTPYVGEIVKVVNADLVWVKVPGLARD